LEIRFEEGLRLNTDKLQPLARPASFSGIIIAWTVVLLVSDLPDALWQSSAGATPAWLFWAKIGILIVMMISGWVQKQIYSLRSFFILLLIFALGAKALRRLGLTLSYAQQGERAGWLIRMATFEASRLLLAAVMVAALMVMGKRRSDLFLVKGDLRKWKRPGVILALSIMVLTFFYLRYNLPSAAVLVKALPLIPLALLFAALLAFDEEVRCRATLLSSLHTVVGKSHAIMITSFFFGMGHYFGGVPSGVEGFLIAGALGWLWATIMLETGGVYMSWLIHFLNNVPTVVSWAIASMSR
jgi:membrane protease YdiL (CAAX protease family)